MAVAKRPPLPAAAVHPIDPAAFWPGYEVVACHPSADDTLQIEFQHQAGRVPTYGHCSQACPLIHERRIRRVRDRDLLDQRVLLQLPVRRVDCLDCGWVPSVVLYSVALQESGARIRDQLVPWPWTLNVAGVGYRFATRKDACQALMIALVTAGPARVDVGLGQTNIGANGHRYNYPCEGLDPYKNLAVTAEILSEQKAKGGSWIDAAGRYHRPAGGAPAARYRESFARHLSRVTGINLLVTNP